MKSSPAQLPLPLTFAACWAVYESTMLRAASAADALAIALVAYVRRSQSPAAFHAACDAAAAYSVATRHAEDWHFGTIPAFGVGCVINLDPGELLAFARELRGDTVQCVTRDPSDPRRCIVEQRYADNGIAGFFRSELRCMRAFGSPRRSPSTAS